MKIVITYGTFDLLHYGHLRLLERAKKEGDFLIVGLSTDKFNTLKGKTAYFSYQQRKKMLESIRYVDKVIPEKAWEQKIPDIKKYKVGIFVMGSDWKNKFNFLKKYCEVKILSRTPEISTSKIKSDISQIKQ